MLLVSLFPNSTQNTSVNWIIRLFLSLLICPKVILLSDGHCTILANFILGLKINFEKKNRFDIDERQVWVGIIATVQINK